MVMVGPLLQAVGVETLLLLVVIGLLVIVERVVERKVKTAMNAM